MTTKHVSLPTEEQRADVVSVPVEDEDEQHARRRPSSRSAKRKPSIFEKIIDPNGLSVSAGLFPFVFCGFGRKTPQNIFRMI